MHGLSPLPLPHPPPGLAIRLALALRAFLLRLADRLVPGEVGISQHAIGVAWTASLGAIARMRIADVLGEHSLSAEEIAARTDTHADAIHRMLRALSANGVFRLRGDGRFENNRLSQALQSNHPSRAREWCAYFSSSSNVHAWLAVEHTLRSGKNGFEHIHGKSVWEWFDVYPDERETFAQVMLGFTLRDAPFIAQLYPWNEIASVCDVGGGSGALLSELLVRYPHLTGVLCDGEGVASLARQLMNARGVSDRVTCVAGNFFENVPPGSDAYLLKKILHDWDDVRCLTILRNIRAAMRSRQRLIVAESIVAKNDQSIGALSDVQMMMVCAGGRERSVEEYQALFLQCGFRPGRVFEEKPLIGLLEAWAV